MAEQEPDRKMNIITGLIVDCVTCTDRARVLQSVQIISELLNRKPGLEEPIRRYAESLRGNVNDGKLNAIISIVTEEANNGRRGSVEDLRLTARHRAEQKSEPGKQPNRR